MNYLGNPIPRFSKIPILQAYQKKKKQKKRKKRKLLTKPNTNKTIFDGNLKLRHRFLAHNEGFNNTFSFSRHNLQNSNNISNSYYDNYFHIIPSNHNKNFGNYNYSKDKFSSLNSSPRESSFKPPSHTHPFSHNPLNPSHHKTPHHETLLASTNPQKSKSSRFQTPSYLSRGTSHYPPLPHQPHPTEQPFVVVGQCYAVQYKTLSKHWVTISDVPSSQRHFNWTNPSRGVKYHFRVVPMFVVTSALSSSAPTFEFSHFNLKSSSGLSRISGHSTSSQRLFEGDPSETVIVDADGQFMNKACLKINNK